VCRFPETLDQAVAVFGSAPLSWKGMVSAPTPAEFRSLTLRLVEEAARNEEAEKRAALEASLGAKAKKASGRADEPPTKQAPSTTSDAATTAAGAGVDSSDSSGVVFGTRSSGRRQIQQQQQRVQQQQPSGSSSGGGGKKEQTKEHAEEWVQCDSCARWRLLPAPTHPMYPGELPDTWNCAMNQWNPSQASCRYDGDCVDEKMALCSCA
jgi:hypothetical protein